MNSPGVLTRAHSKLNEQPGGSTASGTLTVRRDVGWEYAQVLCQTLTSACHWLCQCVESAESVVDCTGKANGTQPIELFLTIHQSLPVGGRTTTRLESAPFSDQNWASQ